MSSDDDIMDANLLSGDEDDQYVTGFDEDDDEDLELNGEGEDIDGELEEDEEELEMPPPKGKINGIKNKKVQDFDDEDEDELENGEAEINQKGDGNILEKLKNARMTHQKFFSLISGNKKNLERGLFDDDEEEQDDQDQDPRSFLVQINEDLNEKPDAETVKKLQKGKQEFVDLVNNLKNSVVDTKQKFLPILAHLKNPNLNIKEGMGYLDAKFHLMNLYSSTLSCYMLLKAQGVSIKDHPIIRRLIYIKTLVTKLKPLDKKLEYQVTKLLRLASEELLVGESYSKKAATEDPLSLKPRPQAMAKTLTTENIEVTEEGDIVPSRKQKQGIYVPSKLRSTLMEDDAKIAKKNKDEERKKSRMLNKDFVNGLERDFGDAPEEVKYNFAPQQLEDKEDRERREYEETYMMRLPQTREDKKKMKQKIKKAQQGERMDDFSEIDKIGAFFKEREKIQKMKDDDKDKLLKKTLADLLTKRKNEKQEEGDDMFGDFGGDDDGELYGARKKVKQDRGRSQVKKAPRGASKEVPTKKMHPKFDKGNGPKKGGFSKGKMGKKRF